MWNIIGLFIMIGVVFYILHKSKKGAIEDAIKKQKAEEEAIRQEKQRQYEAQRQDEERLRLEQQAYDANQRAISQRLFGFVTDTSSILQGLPKVIDVAEHALEEAEGEFADGAFAPFWDAVERAATQLAHFDLGIQQIRDHSDSYKTERHKLASTPPQFPRIAELKIKIDA